MRKHDTKKSEERKIGHEELDKKVSLAEKFTKFQQQKGKEKTDEHDHGKHIQKPEVLSANKIEENNADTVNISTINNIKKSFIGKIRNIFPRKETSTIEKINETLDKKNQASDTKNLSVETPKKTMKYFLSNKELMQKKHDRQKVIISHHEHKRHLKDYLEKAGYKVTDETRISRKVILTCIILTSLLSLHLLYAGIVREDRLLFIFTQIFLSWAIILPALIVIFWVVFYFVIDFKIYNRRKELEEVLPDFLQLTSANINAGMPLDQALWYAVRPRFGVLAKEIEEVAKSTLVGEDLGDALISFSKRYDSPMLKRTVNLMLEGLDAGGEIGPLLNKISVDIQETRIIKKDMAANVTTYVIFISFATIAAAPFLFALSNQLLTIIQNLVSKINIPQQAGGGMSMSFSSSAISIADFNIFAIAALSMTSFFSAVIVSTIKYGNVRDGIKYIPIYITVTVIIYIVATKVLGYFLGGIVI